jgi:hypothetical protein
MAAVGTENCVVYHTTAEAFEQNVYRAHFQVAQWYSALNQDPPPINAMGYGWEVDKAN